MAARSRSPSRGSRRTSTFAEHVAPILQKHCWECHRTGGSAPFSLTNHKQARRGPRRWRRSVARSADAAVVREPRVRPVHQPPRADATTRTTILADWARTGAARRRRGEGSRRRRSRRRQVADRRARPRARNRRRSTCRRRATSRTSTPCCRTSSRRHVDAARCRSLPDNPRVLHHCNMAFASAHGGVQGSELHHRPGAGRRADGPRRRHRVPDPQGLGARLADPLRGDRASRRSAASRSGLRYPAGAGAEAAAAHATQPTAASRSRPARRPTRWPRAARSTTTSSASACSRTCTCAART